MVLDRWDMAESLKMGDLVKELLKYGFSRREANALVYGARLANPSQLIEAPWEDTPNGLGLRRRILQAPNCGRSTVEAVQAYRAHGDASVRPAKPTRVLVELSEGVTAALDAWIKQQPDRPSRPEALRRLAEQALG
jgi:hypothetical protein